MISLLIAFILLPQDEVICKMKNTTPAFYCIEDDLVLEKKDLEKKACWKCEKKPLAVNLCVKTYYLCTTCAEKSLKQGKCCGKKKGRKTSKSLIIWRCKACAKTSLTPKTCNNQTCYDKGRKYRKECRKSGTFPHGNRAK